MVTKMTTLEVSISELKTNPSRFIELAQDQAVCITKNGKVVARLVSAQSSKREAAKRLIGALPPNLDYDALREERIMG
jgi:prevent-host-death family protein